MASFAKSLHHKIMRTRHLLLALLMLSASNLQAAVGTPSGAVGDTPSATKKKIIIDPGHGGHDTGASQQGIHESEIALAISSQLKSRLEKMGYEVLLTRTKDEWISLEKRAALANASRGDLFLSIHINSSTDARAHGKEIYFQNQLPVDEEALFLANRENHDPENPTASSETPGHERIQKAGLRAAEAARIPLAKLQSIDNPQARADVRNILEDLDRSARVRASSELAKHLYFEWEANEASRRAPGSSQSTVRGIRQAPFFLVSNIAMPSVLVEVGFLSHAKEGQKLQDTNYQNALAEALSLGVERYLKSRAL